MSHFILGLLVCKLVRIDTRQGEIAITLHGPEMRAREAFCPPEGEWYAIRFKAGTYMPKLT